MSEPFPELVMNVSCGCRLGDELLPGMRAPIMTRVAWPPQNACMPNHMHETNTRSMTGTARRRVSRYASISTMVMVTDNKTLASPKKTD